MKRWFYFLSLLVVFSLVIGVASCNKTTPSPSPITSSSPAPVPTPTPTVQPIVLSMAPINVPPPPAGGQTINFTNQAKLIETKTNGRVKIEIYWAQALAPVNQIVNAASTGVADIGAIAAAQEPGKVPLDMVAQLPGYGIDYWAQSMAFWDLMNQDPLLSQYAKFNLLPFSLDFIPDYYLISRAPINSVAELKGKKLQATGFVADTLAGLGAVPIAMSPPEQYEGMQKGTIDGNTAPYSAINDFKFYEVAKYIEQFPFGGRVQAVLINKDSWNKISPSDQKIIKSLVPDFIQCNIDAFFAKDQPLFPLTPQLVQDNKVQFIKASDADIAAIQKVQAGQADKWAADQEKAGLPGNKVLADYRALVAKYAKISTFAFK